MSYNCNHRNGHIYNRARYFLNNIVDFSASPHHYINQIIVSSLKIVLYHHHRVCA